MDSPWDEDVAYKTESEWSRISNDFTNASMIFLLLLNRAYKYFRLVTEKGSVQAKSLLFKKALMQDLRRSVSLLATSWVSCEAWLQQSIL